MFHCMHVISQTRQYTAYKMMEMFSNKTTGQILDGDRDKVYLMFIRMFISFKGHLPPERAIIGWFAADRDLIERHTVHWHGMTAGSELSMSMPHGSDDSSPLARDFHCTSYGVTILCYLLSPCISGYSRATRTSSDSHTKVRTLRLPKPSKLLLLDFGLQRK